MPKKKLLYLGIKIFIPIGLSLIIFLFTYWGNHGLGDESRIPIGYSAYIVNSDGVSTYFEPINQELGNQIHINRFKVQDNLLCASLDYNGPKIKYNYIVYDFSTNQIAKFKNKEEYENYSIKYNTPILKELEDFIPQYHKYWSGWRFWLLP